MESNHYEVPREVNATTHTLAEKMKTFPYVPIVFQKPPEATMDSLHFDNRFMHDDAETIM